MPMTSNLEARKLSVIDYLADLNDEALLSQIENLIKPPSDFWDEMTENQRASVLRGLNQVENGEHIAFQDFMNRYLPSR